MIGYFYTFTYCVDFLGYLRDSVCFIFDSFFPCHFAGTFPAEVQIRRNRRRLAPFPFFQRKDSTSAKNLSFQCRPAPRMLIMVPPPLSPTPILDLEVVVGVFPLGVQGLRGSAGGQKHKAL